MRWLALFAGILIAVTGIGAKPVRVDIIAHRGASQDAPENTVASIELAWQQLADGSEFDVYLTKDGKIVVHHDKDTKRTAGVAKTISETTLADLRKLDVGSWKNAVFAGEKIPTLEEMLATVPQGRKVYIEVKCGPQIVPELVRVLGGGDLEAAQTPVISFNAEVVAALKKARPDVPAYWLVDLKKVATTDQIIAKAKQIGADGVDVSASKLLTQKFATKVRAAGLRLDVWTVNDAAVAKRMVDIGVDGITTDRPAWLRQQLSQ